MNRKAIIATAVCTWDSDDECFVVESPVSKIVAAGDTQKEAMQNFRDHVQDYFDDWSNGKLSKHATVGRPSKGVETCSYRLKPEVKSAIAILAGELGISQGEAIHFLLLKYRATQNQRRSG